jgi:GPN-loop GTPase
MVKFAQVILGPAGSGKSTYCAELQRYCNDVHRIVHVVNLDPAAEEFKYSVSIDVRELISVDDVATELAMGPNGALVYCMEFLLRNIEWLEDKLESYVDNDYLVFDLPGQIELYTHFPFMRDLVRKLESWGFRLQAIYMLDSQFMADPAKFFGGSVTALSAMVQLEVSHINVMSKMDLVRGVDQSRLDEFFYTDVDTLVNDLSHVVPRRFLRLNVAVGNLLEDFGMVQFVPLDVTDSDSIASLLLQADLALQYDEEVEPSYPKDLDEDVEDHSDGDCE